MRFSLAMPTRNMASHIGAAATSILSQADVDVELLVQDACSTDTTSDVLAAIGDERLTIVREPDQGQPDAINRALSRATGEILGWLNADDERQRLENGPDRSEKCLGVTDLEIAPSEEIDQLAVVPNLAEANRNPPRAVFDFRQRTVCRRVRGRAHVDSDRIRAF